MSIQMDGQFANERFTGEVGEEKPALCFACNHPYHQITCDCDRTVEDGGVEISGPCGCDGVVTQANSSKE